MKKYKSYLVLIILFIISFMTFIPGGQAELLRGSIDGGEQIMILRFYPYYHFNLINSSIVIPFIIFVGTIILILLNAFDFIKPFKYIDKTNIVTSIILIVLALIQMLLQSFKHLTTVNILIPISHLILIGLIVLEIYVFKDKSNS